MPLETGSSNAVISHNVRELVAAGHPQAQAVAAALHTAKDAAPPLDPALRAPEIADAPALPADKLARRAAGILFITPSSDILFMHRGDGGSEPRAWGLPGGHEEDSDDGDLEKTARREALEETGFDYVGPLAKLFDDGHFVTFLARCEAAFPVTPCDESTGYSWSSDPPSPAHPGLANALRVLRADTELAVAELMRDGVLPSPQRYQNIYMLRLRISGTGMAYRSMVGEHVYRDASLYLNPEMVARCNGLPVILLHPDTPTMKPGDWEKHSCGAIMLPFVEGENLEGIARIYALDAIEELEKARVAGTPISTSPSVLFAPQHENVKVTLENGAQLLIEGKPALIDHLAICALGVWDKGGPATGIQLDNEDLTMATEAEEKAKADAAKADAAKADAEKEAKEKEEREKADAAKADAAKKDGEKSFMDSIKGFCDTVMTRMDAWEKKDAAKADAEEKAKADAARADAEEKEKADKARKDAAETETSMADSAAFADAQALYDSVYSQLGNGAAPRPMAGEKIMAYRARMLTGLKKHSTVYKDSDLGAVARADASAFAGVESTVLEDARKFARTPQAVADGQLRGHTVRTEAGHMVTTYSGDPMAWMSRHMQSPKRVRLSTRAELSRTH